MLPLQTKTSRAPANIKRRVFGCFLGCGVIAIILALVVILVVRNTISEVSLAEPIATQFLKHVVNNNIDDAHSLISTRRQQRLSIKDFQKIILSYRTLIGDFDISQNTPSWQRQVTNNSNLLVISYLLHGSKGNGYAKVYMENDNGLYRVFSFRLGTR